MKLQFKHQPFQAQAAAAVCDVFRGQPFCPAAQLDAAWEEDGQLSLGIGDGIFPNAPLSPELTEARILENLWAVQRREGLPPSECLSPPGINLSVEMETGTGKTYTYTKTIYELNARYGWSKFIIVVPSVAVREGVYKSLLTTQEHFAGEYGKQIRFFIYSSDQLTQVDRFASDSAIHVMIINMQAFNSSKNQRIIDKRLDAFQSRRPMDLIAMTNPILIIDEPQSVEGRQTKESLKKFNPLFTLRYSATHRETYNLVYRLDAVDAYNQCLVKKIAALGVTVTGSTSTNSYVYLEGIDLYKDKAPTARLGFEVKGASGTRTVVKKVRGGDDLYALSQGLEEYSDRYVILPDGIDGRDNSVTFLNGLKLYAGQMQGNEQMISLQRRMQIRETIRTHIRRERELYPRGIKVLSLFFIDEVSKYRVYDKNSGDGRNGEYAKMFEEEYEAVVSSLQRELGDDAYYRYLTQISAHETHQGYFSIDKGKGKTARFVDSKMDRRSQTSDDADAYDLIMRDKERLLSLEEPVRFLFSHSALREGWDNPNVFQICTLKPQSESEIRSRQEIGRGLRLCVNQQGQRMDEHVLGNQVHQLNKLTLITDMAFGKFAQALQAGLAKSMAHRPQRVSEQLFLGKTLTDSSGKTLTVTQDLAQAIYEDLIRQGYVTRGLLTDKYYAHRASGSIQVAGEVRGYAASVVSILSTIYDRHTVELEDVHGSNVQAHLIREKLEQNEFQALWKKIRQKTFYTVSFDSNTLVEKAIASLNAHLDVPSILVKTEYGEQEDKISSKEQLLQAQGFQEKKTNYETPAHLSLGSARYDLIGKLVEETGLTRATVAAILSGMSPGGFSMLRINPEEFILQVGKLINHEKASIILEHIAYHKLDAAFDTSVFTGPTLRGKLGQNAMPTEKSIYDYLIYDSATERAFAQELERQDQVAIYVKLPRSFFISTPVGRYSPDWAIAFREGTSKHIYFVAETKGSRDTMELRGIEAAKIQCAKAHFAAISNGSVTYEVVEDFEQLLHLVS